MPSLSDYQVLNLNGLEIDSINHHGEVLRANFGGGYGAKAVVGGSILHRWSLSSGCWPGDEAYGNLIEGKSRYDYYLDFFTEHTVGDRDVFEIVYRGKRYHASLANDEWDAEMHTSDLFSGGVEIKQRKVRGIPYNSDGSIFTGIADLAGAYSWHTSEFFPSNVGEIWYNNLENGNNPLQDIGADGDVIFEANIQNGFGVVRFNSAIGGGYLFGDESPIIHEAFFVMQVREATFSSGAGLLTNDVGVPLVFGSNGGTIWNNNAIGAGYEYRYNGVTLPESNQTAPMNEFGIVHIRYEPGITLTNLQVGKKTNTSGTLIKADIGEIIFFNANLDNIDAQNVTNYLAEKWAIDV